jgi:hypothetical protein
MIDIDRNVYHDDKNFIDNAWWWSISIETCSLDDKVFIDSAWWWSISIETCTLMLKIL